MSIVDEVAERQAKMLAIYTKRLTQSEIAEARRQPVHGEQGLEAAEEEDEKDVDDLRHAIEKARRKLMIYTKCINLHGYRGKNSCWIKMLQF